MCKKEKGGGVLFFLRANKKKELKRGASAMFTWIMSEKTGETDRIKARNVGQHSLFSMISTRP